MKSILMLERDINLLPSGETLTYDDDPLAMNAIYLIVKNFVCCGQVEITQLLHAKRNGKKVLNRMTIKKL